MQMKALRSLNFLKLSSSNSTSDEYCVRSMSAGTPAGYCLSQMRSMVLPLWFCWVLPPFAGRDALLTAVLSNAAADGKRLRVIDASSVNQKRPVRTASKQPYVRGAAAVFGPAGLASVLAGLAAGLAALLGLAGLAAAAFSAVAA